MIADARGDEGEDRLIFSTPRERRFNSRPEREAHNGEGGISGLSNAKGRERKKRKRAGKLDPRREAKRECRRGIVVQSKVLKSGEKAPELQNPGRGVVAENSGIGV